MEIEKMKSFWTSIPGILTGLAAIITAVTGFYLAYYKNTSYTIQESTPMEWPLVAKEKFNKNSAGWPEGSYANENLPRFDIKFVEGKYRWDMEFLKVREGYAESPYGSAIDFYVAVDVKFVAVTPGGLTTSLLFGRASNKDYAFKISSNNKYELTRFDGKQETILSYTSADINAKEFNRIAVAVEDGEITLYINSQPVGTYKDSTFTGGKVGFSVTGWQSGQATIVEFDNFEFRRKS